MSRARFHLSEDLKQQYRDAVAEDPRYNRLQRSQWVREALHHLMDTDPGLRFVGWGSAERGHSATDYAVLDQATWDRLNAAVSYLRRQDPHWHGVQSEVIRSAIAYRLRHPV